MSAGDDDEKPYRVGYRKPPKETQYKPGESGRSRTPARRPGGSRSRVKLDLDDMIRAVGAKKIKVREGDRVREVTMARIAVEKLVEGAVRSGRSRDLLTVVQLFANAGAFGDRPMTEDEMIADLSNEEIANIEAIRATLGQYATQPASDDAQGYGATDDRVSDTVRLDLDDLDDTEPPPDG